MPRALKPLLVETVRNDRIGMSVDIFFDRDKKDFFATLFKVTHRMTLLACAAAVAVAFAFLFGTLRIKP